MSKSDCIVTLYFFQNIVKVKRQLTMKRIFRKNEKLHQKNKFTQVERIRKNKGATQ